MRDPRSLHLTFADRIYVWPSFRVIKAYMPADLNIRSCGPTSASILLLTLLLNLAIIHLLFSFSFSFIRLSGLGVL